MHPSQWVTHGKLERFHLQAEDSIFLRGRNYRFFFRSSVSRLQVNKSAPLTCVAQRNGLPIFAPRHNSRVDDEASRRRESSRALLLVSACKRKKRKKTECRKGKGKARVPKSAFSIRRQPTQPRECVPRE